MSINVKILVKDKMAQGLTLDEALFETQRELALFFERAVDARKIVEIIQKAAAEIEAENEK